MRPLVPPPIRAPADLIVAKANTWVNGFFLQLPNLVAGAVFLLIAWGVARLVRRGVVGLAHRRGRVDLAKLLGSIAFGIVMVVAVLGAMAIVLPSVNPAEIMGALGLGSVALGFAFKEILQNLFAGILLLINRPFRRGDQIVVKEFEGTVEHVESRATVIKTYDGRRVIIPNADIYTSPVIVNTAFPLRRDHLDIGIGYGDNVPAALEAFRRAVASVEDVAPEPAAEVLPWSLDESSITLRARWWTGSKRTEIVHVKARVVAAVVEAARAHAIDLAYPTQVVLFHNQTEEVDGDRARQREGWPAGADPPRPRATAAGAARA
jgi:small conductance mechanosensitive channel